MNDAAMEQWREVKRVTVWGGVASVPGLSTKEPKPLFSNANYELKNTSSAVKLKLPNQRTWHVAFPPQNPDTDQNTPRGSVEFVSTLFFFFFLNFIIYALTLLSCQHVKCEVKFICSSSAICAHVNLSHKHSKHSSTVKDNISLPWRARTHLHTHLHACTYAHVKMSQTYIIHTYECTYESTDAR